MTDTWVEISCRVPAELTDIVAEYLTGLSGNGVCVENLNVDAFSHSEIPESPTATVRSYFSTSEDSAARLAEISAFLKELSQRHPGCVLPEPELSSVSTEDWSTSWKANFKPMRIGRRLLIVPTWEEAHAHPDDIVLTLDPGMAFGTGHHETTRSCLVLMENYAPKTANENFLDLGIGVGPDAPVGADAEYVQAAQRIGAWIEDRILQQQIGEANAVYFDHHLAPERLGEHIVSTVLASTQSRRGE